MSKGLGFANGNLGTRAIRGVRLQVISSSVLGTYASHMVRGEVFIGQSSPLPSLSAFG